MHENLRQYIVGLQQHVEKWIRKGKNPDHRRRSIDCILADLEFADQWLDLGQVEIAMRLPSDAFRLAVQAGIIVRAKKALLMP